MIHTEEDVLALIQEDDWMMAVLAAAEALQLKDWCVCAGFVRGKIWDTLHGFQRTELPDIDVVYYDSACLKKEKEKEYEYELHRLFPGQPWSVKKTKHVCTSSINFHLMALLQRRYQGFLKRQQH